MKVAIVTQFPEDPNAPHGGVEAVSVNLVRALSASEDLDLHIVTLNSGLHKPLISSWNGTTLHRLPGFNGSVLRTAIGPGRRLISQYLTDLSPDVIHAHDTYGIMVKGLPIPRVFTIHGFIYGDTRVSGEKLARLRSWVWKKVETDCWADQHHIISISPYVRERISGIVKGTIHDIENPIAESFFTNKRAEKPGVVFSAAVISPRKNTLVLVDACRILAEEGLDVHLRLAGKIIEPGYGTAVQERIDANGLRERITLLGAIGVEQVMAELTQASVFALVSLEENAPLGIEEAMAMGVPVVASNRCGMPYMVRHGETGFLADPLDPHDIADRMRQLIRNQDLRKTMGEKSRQFALDRFHPDRVAVRTREVYREALGKKLVHL
jgi:glycosyltransferase involved in cell wall biosynthesis